MAIIYVWSGATGAGTGADFTNAYTTMVAANTAGAAGDEYRVASDHQENLSATLTMKGTAVLPNRVVSVNRGTGVPERMKDSTGYIGTAAAVNLVWGGTTACWGINWQSGGAATFGGAVGHKTILTRTSFNMANANGVKICNSQNCDLTIDNAEITNPHLGLQLTPTVGGVFSVRNSPALFSQGPTQLFWAGGSGTVEFDACDLSNMGAGKSLIGPNSGTARRIQLRACKINSALTRGVPASLADEVKLINCTDETGALLNEKYLLSGNQVTERAIVRTGGATDGVSSIAWKITMTANAKPAHPFESFELDFFVSGAQVGSPVTATVHTVTDNVTLTDADCYLRVDAAVTASHSILTGYNDGPVTPLAAPVNQAASTEAWTTTGLTTPIKQKLEVTFTPARTGAHRLKIVVSRASTVVYVCPQVELA